MLLNIVFFIDLPSEYVSAKFNVFKLLENNLKLVWAVFKHNKIKIVFK